MVGGVAGSVGVCSVVVGKVDEEKVDDVVVGKVDKSVNNNNNVNKESNKIYVNNNNSINQSNDVEGKDEEKVDDVVGGVAGSGGVCSVVVGKVDDVEGKDVGEDERGDDEKVDVDDGEKAGGVGDGFRVECVNTGVDQVLKYLSVESKLVDSDDSGSEVFESVENVCKQADSDDSDSEVEKEREHMLGWQGVLSGLMKEGKLEQIIRDATDPAVNPCINAAVSGT